MAVYTVKTKLFLYGGGLGSWHFAYIDTKTSEIIKAKQTQRRGFGSVKVEATIGKTSWQTSIFPDKRSGCFLLPVKAKVRYEEGLEDSDSFTVKLKTI